MSRLQLCARRLRVITIFALSLAGCGPRLSIVPEREQGIEQLAHDRGECAAEIRKGSRYAAAAGKALLASVGGALAGGAAGGLLGLEAALSEPAPDLRSAPVSAAVGAVIGLIVGAVLGPKKVVQDERHAIARDFRECMEGRGYTVGSDE